VPAVRASRREEEHHAEASAARWPQSSSTSRSTSRTGCVGTRSSTPTRSTSTDAKKDDPEKVADKCYRPTTKLILDLVRRHEGNFRISYAITGTVLDQLERCTPDVIELFQQMAETGCCEFVGETYFHSLAFLYSRAEFREQVEMHTRKIRSSSGRRRRSSATPS
jgi:alpha-amylase/alpha-mannosidase (GH57 family)